MASAHISVLNKLSRTADFENISKLERNQFQSKNQLDFLNTQTIKIDLISENPASNRFCNNRAGEEKVVWRIFQSLICLIYQWECETNNQQIVGWMRGTHHLFNPQIKPGIVFGILNWKFQEWQQRKFKYFSIIGVLSPNDLLVSSDDLFVNVWFFYWSP